MTRATPFNRKKRSERKRACRLSASRSGILASFVAAGPAVAPFADFQQTRADVSQTFDTSALHHLELIVGQGDYDFCVHDFKFLNAAGREVSL
jgi:hypothetical protein